MVETHTDRRLAAILAADVVGYSKLMSVDELGTLAALKHHRSSIFNPLVAQYHGRVVKLMGDGTLAEFRSVIDAVGCAVAIQRAVSANPIEAKIKLRIGINLGDVIVEGDDIYGDGVNVAARLEPLAEPGGICISAIVNESVSSRVEAFFEEAGEVHVKNIERPIRVWKWHPSLAQQAPSVKPVLQLDNTPSIAVLPFTNMSGDIDQEYFSDGITDDVITDLSKVGGLTVIARNSSFAYKGKNLDVRTIGRELGVGAVLEGSIRRAGKRLRIIAQLIDARTGAHVWAERYDRQIDDIFALQDEVTREIVAALRVAISPTEKNRWEEIGNTNSVEAHDFVLRARQLLFGSLKNREIFDRINGLLNQAIVCDPNYSEPYAGLAWAHELDHHNHWSDHFAKSLEMAEKFAELAIERGPREPFAHFVAGVVASFRGKLERARREAEIALGLNPNYALAHSVRGIADIYDGDPLAAIPWIERGMRLDPAFTQQYLHFLGTANLTARKFETAAAQFRQRVILVPSTDLSRALLASALGHLGEVAEAHRAWKELRAINPHYSLEEHIGRLPFRKPADVATIREGFAKARLPDLPTGL